MRTPPTTFDRVKTLQVLRASQCCCPCLAIQQPAHSSKQSHVWDLYVLARGPYLGRLIGDGYRDTREVWCQRREVRTRGAPQLWRSGRIQGPVRDKDKAARKSLCSMARHVPDQSTRAHTHTHTYTYSNTLVSPFVLLCCHTPLPIAQHAGVSHYRHRGARTDDDNEAKQSSDSKSREGAGLRERHTTR